MKHARIFILLFVLAFLAVSLFGCQSSGVPATQPSVAAVQAGVSSGAAAGQAVSVVAGTTARDMALGGLIGGALGGLATYFGVKKGTVGTVVADANQVVQVAAPIAEIVEPQYAPLIGTIAAGSNVAASATKNV